MITADTITDEQIRQLRSTTDDTAIMACCSRALNAGLLWSTADINRARARCAEILNARARGDQ